MYNIKSNVEWLLSGQKHRTEQRHTSSYWTTLQLQFRIQGDQKTIIFANLTSLNKYESDNVLQLRETWQKLYQTLIRASWIITFPHRFRKLPTILPDTRNKWSNNCTKNYTFIWASTETVLYSLKNLNSKRQQCYINDNNMKDAGVQIFEQIAQHPAQRNFTKLPFLQRY